MRGAASIRPHIARFGPRMGRGCIFGPDAPDLVEVLPRQVCGNRGGVFIRARQNEQGCVPVRGEFIQTPGKLHFRYAEGAGYRGGQAVQANVEHDGPVIAGHGFASLLDIHEIEHKPRRAMPQGKVPGVKPRKGQRKDDRESPEQPFSAGRGKGVRFQWSLRVRVGSSRESAWGSI